LGISYVTLFFTYFRVIILNHFTMAQNNTHMYT
jgi:hypothetical protein